MIYIYSIFMYYHHMCLTVFITALNGVSFRIRNHLANTYKFVEIGIIWKCGLNNCITVWIQIKCLENIILISFIISLHIHISSLSYLLVFNARIYITYSVWIHIRICFITDLANFFCWGPNSKYFSLHRQYCLSKLLSPAVIAQKQL